MKLLKSTFADTVYIPIKSAAIMGIIFYDRREPISKFIKIINWLYFGFCFTCLALAALGETINIFALFSVNFLAVTNVVPCMCYCTISLCRSGSVAANVNKCKKLLNDLEDIWPVGELTDKETSLVIRMNNKARQAQVFYNFVTILFGVTFDTSSILLLVIQYLKTGEVVKALPFLVYMPFDTTGKYSYPLAYIFLLIAAAVANLGLIIADTFFVATVMHICTQFKLLKLKILHIVEESIPAEICASLDIDHDLHQKVYDALIECVKRHSKLIKLCNSLEEMFSGSFLYNFMAGSIIICCVGFNSTACTGMELIIFTVFLVVGLYQIYILCWAGDQLIESSKEIADAAYNCSWYLTTKSVRKLIQIIILRAQRPQVITALRFSVLSFDSFSSILSTSYSYFTLLQTTYKKN